MPFLLVLGWALFSLATFFLRPKQPGPPPWSGRTKFQLPGNDEGTPIPRVVGTGLVRSPMVLGWWDYDETPAFDHLGVPSGIHYFMGLHYGICVGPIDRVVDVRYDNTTMTVVPITTSSTALVVKVGGTPYTVTFPAASYATQILAAQAYTAAMRAAAPDPLVRCVYGYEILQGWNDTLAVQFVYTPPFGGAITTTVVPITVRPGAYTAASLVLEIQHQIDVSPLAAILGYAQFVLGYDNVLDRFSAASGSTIQVTLLAAGSNMLATLGWPDDTDVRAFSYVSPHYAVTTGQYRFFFTMSAGTVIAWTDAGTSCYTIFGMSNVGPDFSAPAVCLADRIPAGEGTVIADMGYETRVAINAPAIFGGDEQGGGGGITAQLDIYHGADVQPFDGYLATKFGTPAPTYPGLCHCVAAKHYQGNRPSLYAIQFQVEACPNELGLPDGHHQIATDTVGFDANPACWLYSLATDTRDGLGLSPLTIDVDSFTAAGETLWREGAGYSIVIETSSTAQSLIDDVLRHIDGVMFSDAMTGLLTLKLVRADYDPGALPVLGDDDFASLKFARTGWDQLKNVVKVTFPDRASSHADRTVQVQDLAGIQLLGRQIVEDVRYDGASCEATATLIAQRHLATVSYPLARIEGPCSRKAWALRPGDPFILNWSKLGITGMVCRVTRHRSGEVRSNAISIEAVEDIYSLTRTAFAPIQ